MELFSLVGQKCCDSCQNTTVMTSSVCCAAGGDQNLIFLVCRIN